MGMLLRARIRSVTRTRSWGSTSSTTNSRMTGRELCRSVIHVGVRLMWALARLK